MEDLHTLHKKIYGRNADVSVRTPGKLNLMGEHTEYFEGLVLAVAVNRFTEVSISKREDNSVRVYSANYDERKKSSLSGLKYKREDRWANYVKGAVAVLLQLGCPVKGLDIAIQSDIPEQVGLGSSSAMTMALVSALKQLYNFEISDIQLVESARLAEMKFMQKDPGLAACAVSYFGKEDHALLIDTKTMDISYINMDFKPIVMLVTDSNVPNGSGYGELDDLKHDFDTCKEYLGKTGRHITLRDVTVQDIRSELEQIPEHIRRRAIHIIEENLRVRELKHALETGDLTTAGKLMYRSHESLRDMLEISCPELDWLVKRAYETHGVMGSRMVGNGFGGCTINLINDNNIPLYDEHLEEYDRIFGFKADYFICTPVSGLKALQDKE
ncbi:MAG: galactokinase [Spirochaetales bacterium]|nr:galactokinase [Spirochaetales bacterium]